ncbi:MAG: Acetyltransferase [Devosia sp.]|uniref:GNAT family N-acetyltransferase n=1 Tax=Devosia sp. TaxID=1871048 RepID=UPI0026064955|nr:N-acetyltransferase [Devosia sp.]MDB5541410.1 Acetyltransferase [Devosia sp.]
MISPSVSVAAEAAPPQSGLPSVRFATPRDDQFVEDLQALAFGPGRFARTAFRVRERFPIDASLSLIAEVDGVACGSVWMTPISVGGIDGYLLGPLATHPDFRKRGAGKLLAKEVTRIALERGEGSFVLLVGDRDYYCPLGWVPTQPGAIEFPGPVDPSRVLVNSNDPTMAVRLAGPIKAFGASKRS